MVGDQVQWPGEGPDQVKRILLKTKPKQGAHPPPRGRSKPAGADLSVKETNTGEQMEDSSKWFEGILLLVTMQYMFK